MGFSSLIIEFRPISNRIPEYHHFGSSDPEVLVDQVSDLSSTKETVPFWGFLLLQTDLSFELSIMDDSVQC